MRQKATVEAALPDGRVSLLVQRESACSGDCHKCAGCGAVGQTIRLTAENVIRAVPGDKVYIESSNGVLFRAVALVYLLPMVLFFVGYFVFIPFGKWAVWIGFAAFAAGWIVPVLYDRKIKKRPPIHRIVGFVE